MAGGLLLINLTEVGSPTVGLRESEQITRACYSLLPDCELSVFPQFLLPDMME